MTRDPDNKLRLILFFFAFLIYANTIGHDYAWDDSIVVTENPRIKKGLSGIPDLFLKYNSDYKADKYGYRPIVLTSLAVEYSFFKLSPHAGHFMNVLYFALLCTVMFKVLRKVLFRFSNLAPFLITLLFAAHPVHVEAVANIKSRDEIFSLLFALLALSRFIDYHQTRQVKWLIYTIMLFMLAFLSKESAIVFLLIMPLTLIYMESWSAIKKIAISSLFIPVMLIISVAIMKLSAASTLGTQALKGAGVYYESGLLGNSFFYTAVLSTKLANACTVLLLYLKNFFYPVTLLYYYGYNQVPVASWQQPLVIVSFLLHAGAFVFAIINLKKHAEISYGIFFYFIAISIYTHIFRTLSDTMADRFLFTPSLGLVIITVFAISRLLRTDLKTLKAETLFSATEKNNVTMRYLFLVIVLLYSVKTFTRNKVWKNDEALVMHDMPELENCSRAHGYYADLLRKKLVAGYDPAIELDMISHYKKSYHIAKESYYAYLGLGTYLCGAQRFDEGIAVLDSMVKVYPDQADPNFYLGRAYYQVAQYKKAIPYLERSIQLAPEVESSYNFMALAYSKNIEFEKAVAIIESAKGKFAPSVPLYETMGTVYFEKGDMEKSTEASLELLQFGGDAQRIYSTIIGRYQVKKQDSLAAVYYRQALAKGLFKKAGQNP